MSNFDFSFAEFAAAVRPSGAVNRFPSLGVGAEVFSYSVYMNGPLASALPAHLREHEFKDVTLHALTEKLRLDPRSARDNLKVAEIVAVRSAWMSAVLESTVERSSPLEPTIAADYALLTNGMTHPWIVEELDKQRAIAAKLKPALDRAGQAVGGVIRDLPPKELSTGVVVAQDDIFTMQKTLEGEVVTHENRRLESIPAVGAEVTVSYYRGSGQVVNSLANMKVSPPYLFPGSKDLAVTVEDGKGVEQVVLFNSMTGFERFIKTHGAETDLIRQAMDLRAAAPKAVEPTRTRQLASDVYIDASSGCLAVDYKESGVVYSAMFGSALEMDAIAHEFGIGPKELSKAQALESSPALSGPGVDARSSEAALRAKLSTMEYLNFQDSGVEGRLYMGKIVAASALHVAQDIGRRTAVVHDLRTLDKAPAVGDSLTVRFENGRGTVSEIIRAAKDLGR